ncbi:major facilitator superfamily domain-containing protein [Dactylonectria macrodidyma]|uniref:Major facilitator superfamily domain-containing protein n=1 Tax=Dactylonectria macrodidyma TaxID=307937 RepID=A0A9P9JGY3_9HYPO|nr:major facilitator superfamily domain-containing protein [Dactylonectria macrodidyma]
MSPSRSKPPFRTTSSSGSFHAGAPILTPTTPRRNASSRYQTFPSTPPKTQLSPLSDVSSEASEGDANETPLPVRQLLLLAFLSLAEQTALNSIGPYLPEMVAHMPGIPPNESGLYVGTLASAFALAQLSTNFLWGYASDRIGRKPVLFMGTFSLMCCFCVFGLCREYWQIVVVHVAMGLLNGNAACVPTVLGEVTDRSNQSKAFTYLPIIYSLGGITGPALGGLLVGKVSTGFPFLGPNIMAASLLACSLIVVGIWFEETLDEPDTSFTMPAWISKLTSLLPKRKSEERRKSWSARWPRGRSRMQPLLSSSDSGSEDNDGDDDDDLQSDQSNGEDDKSDSPQAAWRHLSGTTILLLCTYLVFQLSNISFNSLYPIFADTPPPAGRDLLPSKIGLSLSLAGLATIVFQAFLYQPLKARVGNLGTYQMGLFGIGIAMILLPWVGYKDDAPLFGQGSGEMWLYIELGVVLIVKNICAVGGLSSVMLLITNSAPSNASLGALNGIAQTLSALGRSIGPFVSGALFTLSTNIHPKGEVMVFSVFGGLALCGCFASLFIRRDGLESDDWEGPDSERHADEEEAS